MESGGRDPSRPPAATTAEEEAVKRNTDCVYFLASPLTCKKGHECEYRHSEGARVNPRDCWYWLNGNCLNPKCLFRHPPLDALLATPTTPSGLAVPPLQAPTISQTPAPLSPAVHNPNKQSVPCYYFQKGLCLKGDRCPFLHGPQPIGNPVSQQPPKVAASVTELPQTTKKASWGLEKCVSQQSIPRVSVDKLMEVTPSLAMPVDKTITAPANGLPVKNYELPIPLGDEHPPRSQPTNLHVSSDITPSRPHIGQVLPSDEHFQNGREAGEFLRESSPGFDVLVDDEPEDPNYYRNDDDFGGISGHGVRNLNPVNDFDYLHTASDYDTATKFEREPYNGTGDYDRYGVLYDRHSRKHHRASSERILERSPMPERKGYRGDENPDETDGLDLRHRLLKQRRLNGSGSAVIPDRRRGEPYPRDDRYTEEQRYRGHSSRRDQRHFSRESSIRNRLQGRITLPVQPSSDNTGDLHSERGDRERGRSWGRSSSPGRLVSHQGRHHDRLKLRAHEDFTAVARNVGGQSTRRDEVDDPLNFAGPKSLAELKGAKVYSDNSDERSTKRSSGAIISQEQRNMKLGKALGHQEPEESLPFEGPKPLSVILKRKRESSHGNAAVSSGEEEDNNQTIPLESKTEANDSIDRIGQPQDRAEEEEEGLISMNGEDLSREVLSSARGDVAEMEDETGMDMEDPQLENYEQRNEESDYEAMDGGEFKTEEDDEIAYEDDGDLDDEDDGDDFARKLGVIFS